MAFSRVNNGLQGLTKVSDNVASGNTAGVPDIYRNRNDKLAKGTAPSVDAGGNAVLGSVGVNPQLLAQHPPGTNATVDAGRATANGVYVDVAAGTFTKEKIAAAQAPLEALEGVLGNTPSAKSNNTINNRVKAYAVDRAYSSIHPKFKFLYVIQFEFSKNFTEFADDANFMAFAVRSASRPTVSVEYEDINMYNFKTKVPKYSEYQPATMTFYDDQSNKTTTFYKKYIEALIPNAKMRQGTQNQYESSQFNFTSRTSDSINNSSSLQALPVLPGGSGDNNIIKSIKLFHIWNWGQSLNIYHYFNPKISEINIGDLDMDSQEVTEIEIQFNYDGLFIETVSNQNPNRPISLDPASEDSNDYDITKLTTLPGLEAPNPIQYNSKGLEPHPSLGTLTSVSQALTEPVLDNLDLSAVNGGDFPDFDKILSNGISINDAINGNGSVIDRFRGTLSTAKNAFGNAIPNINNLDKLFNTTVTPIVEKIDDYKNKGRDIDF